MLLVNIGWVLVLAVPLFCLCLDSLAEGVAYISYLCCLFVFPWMLVFIALRVICLLYGLV